MQCPACGAEVRATEHGRCPECGAALIDLDASGPEETEPTATRPATLSAGTLLRDRYTILEVLTSDDERVVYLATEGGSVRRCWQCGVLVQGSDLEFCDECGADLSAGRYRVTEWWTGTDDAGLDAFARSGLTHDGWLMPLDWFVWNGHRYMAQAYTDGQSLLAIDRPPAHDDALTWSLTLGEAIQTLHTNGFAGLSLRPADMIVTRDRRVKIADFRDMAVYPGGPPFPEAAVIAARQRDIQSLAALFTLLFIDRNSEPDPADAPDVEPPLRAILTRMTAGDYADVQTVVDDLRGLTAPAPGAVVTDMPASRRHGLRYLVGSRSDIGQNRTLNEDSLVTLDLSVIRESKSEAVGLYVVADGMGGHEGGEVASRIAIGAIVHSLTSRVFQPTLDGVTGSPDEGAHAAMLKDAIQAAHDAILTARPKSQTDMGTTVTAALVVGSFACVANVGDSRTYLLRQGRLTQLTIDHSLVARLVAIGMVRPEDIYTHPQRNQIYRALGDASDLEIDTFLHTLLPGDRLLLCSDGLWEMVRDSIIEPVLRAAPHPQAACDTLVTLANEYGGEDNITVIVVQVVENER